MAYTPGTKMPEQTIGSAEDREALVQFLGRRRRGSVDLAGRCSSVIRGREGASRIRTTGIRDAVHFDAAWRARMTGDVQRPLKRSIRPESIIRR